MVQLLLSSCDKQESLQTARTMSCCLRRLPAQRGKVTQAWTLKHPVKLVICLPLGQQLNVNWKMIKMSLDKESVKLSPAFATTVNLSEQPQRGKSVPLPPKNGFLPASNSSGPANQRLAKRRYSVGVAFKGLTKRRRRANSESQPDPRLPSHFLLGGNIFDPLNLNSLLDEDVNK